MTKQTIHTVQGALESYRLHHAEACPDDLDALHAGGTLNRQPRDAWGEPFSFNCPAEEDPLQIADIASKGPDRTEGTADDIASWTMNQREE